MLPGSSSNNSNEAATPPWQRALAGISLAVVNLVVVLPIALTLLLLWTAVLAVVGALLLDAAGSLRKGSFEAALTLAMLVLGVAGLASLGGKAVQAIRRKPPTIPTAPSRPGRWLLRHPWISAGLLLLMADVLFVPLDLSGAADVHTVPIGAAMLGTVLWLVATLGYLLVRGWVLGLGLVWAGVRRSQFFAGLVVVGSLAASLGGYLLGLGLSNQAAALGPPEPPEEIATCGPSTIECTRRALKSAAQPRPTIKPRWSLPPDAPAPPVRLPARAEPAEPPVLPARDPQPAFDECIRELHRADLGRESARDEGVRIALRSVLDRTTAEDVVHATMLSVCTVAERIQGIRPYFFRALQNAIRRERRNGRRWCPMVPELPTWPPDGCVARNVEELTIRHELEDSASAALCSLDVENRWIIEVRLWEELSYDEIAARLQISPENARQRYSRALAELRNRFALRCR